MLVVMGLPKIAPAPPASSPASRIVMRANRAKDTAPELALRRELHRRGLRYRKHVVPLPGLRCRADVVFRAARIAVFVDGCFWHRCPEHGELPKANRAWWKVKLARTWERDRFNDRRLAEAGWTVVRVWEHDDPSDAADGIERLVASASGHGRPSPPAGSLRLRVGPDNR